jgi:hypothetical protein
MRLLQSEKSALPQELTQILPSYFVTLDGSIYRLGFTTTILILRKSA